VWNKFYFYLTRSLYIVVLCNIVFCCNRANVPGFCPPSSSKNNKYIKFSFSMPKPCGNAQIKIYNAFGNLMWESDKVKCCSFKTIKFNGKDNLGRGLYRDIYTAVLEKEYLNEGDEVRETKIHICKFAYTGKNI